MLCSVIVKIRNMSNIRNRFVDNLILGKNTNDMFGIILIQEHLKLLNLVS